MNFALILFLLTVVTGCVWITDRVAFRRKRQAGTKEPWWVEYGASFFPVFLAVFFLRSFLVEPFKIPSGSMIPTLLVGDFILVNKFAYGIRLPIVNKKIIDVGQPQRGDVMVFRYPEDPSLDYIKRVVGLAGDHIEYRDKRLTVNGKLVVVESAPDYRVPDRLYFTKQFIETLGGVRHSILIDPEVAPSMRHNPHFPFVDRCNYNSAGFACDVPAGHYFMMGDNRDASSDSRVWGFVPDENIVGKAFLIWFNFSDLKRIGSFQ